MLNFAAGNNGRDLFNGLSLMCKISIDTVHRANRKTIMQVGRQKAYSGTATPMSSFDVSVSVMGKVYGQSITANQIKRSFSKALENHA